MFFKRTHGYRLKKCLILIQCSRLPSQTCDQNWAHAKQNHQNQQKPETPQSIYRYTATHGYAIGGYTYTCMCLYGSPMCASKPYPARCEGKGQIQQRQSASSALPGSLVSTLPVPLRPAPTPPQAFQVAPGWTQFTLQPLQELKGQDNYYSKI